MAFSYGKLRPPPPEIDVDDLLRAQDRKVKLLTIFLLIVLATPPVVIVWMFFRGQSEMLTNHTSFTDGGVLGFLFWVAVLIGSFIGLRYPTKWWKRIVGAVVASLMVYLMFMLATGIYDKFQEYLLFNTGQSTIDYEEFTIVGVDRSRKQRLGDRRPRVVYVVVESEKYRKQGNFVTDHQTYDFLLANGGELRKMGRRAIYINGHCVKLRVEHNGDAARIWVDGRITMNRIVKCSIPNPSQAEVERPGA
jgi:hypothetical protein